MDSIFDCYNTIRYCINNKIVHERLHRYIVNARVGTLEDVTMSEITLFRLVCSNADCEYPQQDLITLISCIKTIYTNRLALDSFTSDFVDMLPVTKAYCRIRLSDEEIKRFRTMFRVISMGDYDTFLDSNILANDLMSTVLASIYTVVSINFKREGTSRILNCSAVNRILKDARLADVFLYRVMCVSLTTAKTENVVSFLTYLVDTVIQTKVSEVDVDMHSECNKQINKLEEEIKQIKKKVPQEVYIRDTIQDEVALTDTSYIEAKPLQEGNTTLVRISDNDKKKIINKRNILIVKSTRVHLKPFSKNFRIENIETVSKEVLKGDFECVVVITKMIPHSLFYKVKSLTSLPLYLASSTNKDKLLVEIYDRMVGESNEL